MTDDRMETITDRALIRDSDEPDERGDFPCCADRAHKESLGGDSESGTYNRSNRPPAGPRPNADDPWALLPDDHPERAKQCGGCGTKWVDAETARACERQHGDDITTPAPVGAAVALDLDALHEAICDNFTGMAEVRQAADLLVAEVRRLRQDIDECWVPLYHDTKHERDQATARAESAEAEVVTLRAKVAAVEALTVDWPCSDDTCDGDCTGCAYASDLRAALTSIPAESRTGGASIPVPR